MKKAQSEFMQSRAFVSAVHSKRSEGIDPSTFKTDAERLAESQSDGFTLSSRKMEIQNALSKNKLEIARAKQMRFDRGIHVPPKTWKRMNDTRAKLIAELTNIENALIELKAQKIIKGDKELNELTFERLFMKMAKEMLARPVYDRIVVATLHIVGDSEIIS